MLAAPLATLVANGLTFACLGEEWDVPARRTPALNPGTTGDARRADLEPHAPAVL
jgi:hypothetical protein